MLCNEFLEAPDQNDLKLQIKDLQAERQVVDLAGQLRAGQYKQMVKLLFCFNLVSCDTPGTALALGKRQQIYDSH